MVNSLVIVCTYNLFPIFVFVCLKPSKDGKALLRSLAARAAVIYLQAWLGLEDLLSRRLIPLAGGFSSSLSGPVQKRCLSVFTHDSPSHTEWVILESNRANKTETSVFYYLILRVTDRHLCWMLLVTQNNTGSMWRHDKYHKEGIIGGPLRGCLPQLSQQLLSGGGTTNVVLSEFSYNVILTMLLLPDLHLFLLILWVHSLAFSLILEPFNILSINVFSAYGSVVCKILKCSPRFLSLV